MVWPETKAKQTIKAKTYQNKKKQKKHKILWQKQIKHQEHEECSNWNPTNTNHKRDKFHAIKWKVLCVIMCRSITKHSFSLINTQKSRFDQNLFRQSKEL
jgi:hypothetical protein